MRHLNLRTLKFDDRSEASRTLRVEVQPFSLGGETYTVDGGAVQLVLSASRVGARLALHGAAVAVLRGPCQRCLNDATIEVRILAEDYVFDGSSQGMEPDEAYVRGGVLDLDQWMRDALADALPGQLVCRPDCKGLCPVCGADLNLAPAPHEHAGT